jgi:hypothetical protein
VYQQQLKKQVKISNAPIGAKAELRTLKSGQGQFFGILVAILKITAKLEIPEVL